MDKRWEWDESEGEGVSEGGVESGSDRSEERDVECVYSFSLNSAIEGNHMILELDMHVFVL